MLVSMQLPQVQVTPKVNFTGKSIYMENAEVVDNNPVISKKNQDHMNKARLLAAVKHFLSPNKTFINQGFTMVKPKVQSVYTVIAPEIGPNSDKLIISELETDEDAISTEIHELEANDFSAEPEYLKIFHSLREAIIETLDKHASQNDILEGLKGKFHKFIQS